ncbi:MAG: NUDIX domain-containing protein [Rickettsiales bacterium]|nr:NUDIX domain-containing protein [Rickettsiales bacterium]
MRMNISVVFDKDEQNILMCLRSKDPYKGLYNLNGGKIEPNEGDLESAYRELFEETGISDKDIKLIHFMDFNYLMSGHELQVYVGKLNKSVELKEEQNKLSWHSIEENFFDMAKFAGEGNIGHIIENVKFYKRKLFNDGE